MIEDLVLLSKRWVSLANSIESDINEEFGRYGGSLFKRDHIERSRKVNGGGKNRLRKVYQNLDSS